LTDKNGNSITKANFAQKTVLMDFWFTGCQGCIPMAAALQKVKDRFKSDSNVVFANVSVDKSKITWLNSIKEGRFTGRDGIHLFTNSFGQDHPVIKSYAVDAFPRLYLIDPSGNIAANPLPDPRSEKGLKDLISAIEKQTLIAQDGPYVLGDSGEGKIRSIKNGNVFNQDEGDHITAATDRYDKRFNITLKNKIETENSEFPAAEKLLVFSDIEGNFEALRMLLQNNNVIDSNFNWTFGPGHLVFAGDMFDRGAQVTECLWLIYTLEQKANAAGGHVHFILGNHEIMNLSGDHRYVQSKYLTTTQKLGKTYSNLFGEDSELGKWLRSKNVVEKIGHVLFMHGGFSEKMLALKLPLISINREARPYYDRDSIARNSVNKSLSTIYSSSDSPFWYRNYYLNSERKTYNTGETVYRTTEETIDSTLKLYDVKHIVTGHTILADTISSLFNNKVINTDVPHAKGKSEALLIEGNSFYRVNDKGQRFLLFKDEEKVVEESMR
jgi:cytochrome oxidase Cu insertion factor (SCO1/SenC/PrrC family)